MLHKKIIQEGVQIVLQQVPNENYFSICRMVKRFKEIGNVHTKNLLGQQKTTDENLNTIRVIMENDPTTIVK